MGVKAAQRRAAKNLLSTAKYSAGSTVGELNATMGTYDASDRQARAAADVQFAGNSDASAADRFSQLLALQGSMEGLRNQAGNALQGSQMGSLTGMVRKRNNMDTNEALNTLRQNQQGVQSALTENLNDTSNKRRAAINAATLGLRNLEASVSTDLNNINPSLYKKPGTSSAKLGSAKMAARLPKVQDTPATRSGYILPDAAPIAPVPSARRGTSYFDQLMNMYNQRSA